MPPVRLWIALLLLAVEAAALACADTGNAGVVQQSRFVECDSLSSALTVTARSVRTVLRDVMLTDPIDESTPWRRGCSLSIVDSVTARNEQPPGDGLNRWFEDRRWIAVLRYSADGPDGTQFAYRRGATLCVVNGRWDGGDDADSTYVPAPGSSWMIRCVLLSPADTTG